MASGQARPSQDSQAEPLYEGNYPSQTGFGKPNDNKGNDRVSVAWPPQGDMLDARTHPQSSNPAPTDVAGEASQHSDGRSSGDAPTPSYPGNLKALISQKERELHDVYELRVRTLESVLSEKDKQIHEHRTKFERLREDFNYNLSLIEERDTELARYDLHFSSLKTSLHDKELDLSDSKIQIADLQSQLAQEKAKSREVEENFHEKMLSLRQQLDDSQFESAEKSRNQVSEHERIRRELERQVKDREDDLERQRKELTDSFEEALKQREDEYQRALDDLNSTCMDSNRKIRIQETELTGKKTKEDQLQSDVRKLQESLHEKDQTIKNLKWEMEDQNKLLEAKLKDTQMEKKKMEDEKAAVLQEFESKTSELLRNLHAAERAYVQQKDDFEAKILRIGSLKDSEALQKVSQLEAQLATTVENSAKLEESLEKEKSESRQQRWKHKEEVQILTNRLQSVEEELAAAQNAKDDKTETSRALNEELSQTRDEVAKLQEELREKDIAIGSSEEANKTLTEERDQARQESEALKNEVQKLKASEADLKVQMVQLNLQWERKANDDDEKNGEGVDTDMVKLLRTERDEATESLRSSTEKVKLLETQLSVLNRGMMARSSADSKSSRTRLSQIRFSDEFGSPLPTPPVIPEMPLSPNYDDMLRFSDDGSYRGESSTSGKQEQGGAHTTHTAHGLKGEDNENRVSTESIRQLRWENNQLKSDVGALELQNKQMLEVVRDMKQEMVNMQRHTQSQGQNSRKGLHPDQPGEGTVDAIQAGSADGKGQGGSGGGSSRFGRMLSSSPRIFASADRTTRYTMEDSPESEVDSLRLKQELETASQQIQRLAAEKEKLMDISNMLRYDLKMAKQSNIDDAPIESEDTVDITDKSMDGRMTRSMNSDTMSTIDMSGRESITSELLETTIDSMADATAVSSQDAELKRKKAFAALVAGGDNHRASKHGGSNRSLQRLEEARENLKLAGEAKPANERRDYTPMSARATPSQRKKLEEAAIKLNRAKLHASKPAWVRNWNIKD